ncbi:AraC family transcriptional regulator [Caenispirillum bisanense]|uniref:Transcriptional regulator, AraC family n=1 Tax=Caenispirillum bisanense TaxID=414052 RepID=A0A286GAK6_9PROT|nr:AraC family transcriptional regulator [Caenispirillum bisanense]SOD92179.1 transcriptional regulator, AraC family [Caenispirillum bisanense]
MPRTATTLDYSRRIQAVIAHIGEHLDGDLSLERLADVACLSPFHFHRVYRHLTGETVAETIRRLRLARATADLVRGRGTLERVARRAGYGSVAAFTRAFGGTYGTTPAAYRAAGRLVSPAMHVSPIADEDTSMTYDVEIRDSAPLTLAAMRHTGPYMGIGAVFDRLYAWAAPRGLAGREAPGIGLYWDDPGSVPEARLRSAAAIPVTTPVDDPAVETLTLPAGPCAVIRHVGPYAELERSYLWLYREWLPQSGREPADQPCREVYLNDPRTTAPAELVTEIHLPLKA